jgi:GNAT superfamily N-acetyltransferase
VAELDGEVVGVCQLIVFRHLQAHGGLCAEVESMHVHPDHRSGGAGAALLAEAVARAGALGCYRIQLTSNTARSDAHRFYERLGFVPSHVGFKMRLT